MGDVRSGRNAEAIVDRLERRVKKAVADPPLPRTLRSQALDPMYMTPDEFAKLMRTEVTTKYETVVKDSGARLE